MGTENSQSRFRLSRGCGRNRLRHNAANQWWCLLLAGSRGRRKSALWRHLSLGDVLCQGRLSQLGPRRTNRSRRYIIPLGASKCSEDSLQNVMDAYYVESLSFDIERLWGVLVRTSDVNSEISPVSDHSCRLGTVTQICSSLTSVSDIKNTGASRALVYKGRPRF